MANTPTAEWSVVVSRHGLTRVDAGHVWLFDTDVAVDGAAPPPAGAVVRLTDGRGRVHGRGFYSARSRIAVRVATRGGAAIDDAWWEARLAAAMALRARLLPDEGAVRLINAEGDGLPGVVVDRYGPVAVVQLTTPAADARREWLAAHLMAQPGIAGVHERSDGRGRTLEGLPPRSGVVMGVVPDDVAIDDGGVTVRVDPRVGHKTGVYLDQRQNRRRARAYVAPGARALDLFCYHGGFALHLAAAGAHVTAVDSSREALERAHRDAVDGGLAERIELRAADAFEVLSGLSREKPAPTFDLIVVDPPAFAPNRRTVASGLRGYKDLNLRALRLLPPGGVLITCSCSAHVTAADFAEVVAAAAADAGRAVQVLERRGADVDHPALLGAAETHYLKCLILRAF